MQKQLSELISFLQSEGSKADFFNFIIVLSVGLAVAFAVNYILGKTLLRILSSNKWLPAKEFVSATKFLASGLIFTYFTRHALDAFKKLPPWLWQWKDDAIPCLYGIVFFVFGLKAVDVLVEFLRKRLTSSSTDIDETILTFIGRFIKVIIIIALALVVLENFGFKMTTLLASMGFLGAALALAFQSTLANVIAFFTLVSERVFRMGDYISTGEHEGFVIHRGLRSITIQALHGGKINIPNKELVDKQISNRTKGKTTLILIKIGITYDNSRAAIEKAIVLLKSIFEEIPEVKENSVTFQNFGEFTIDLQAVLWAEYKSQGELNQIRSQANLRIKEKFDEAGIEFAFPTHTVYLKQNAKASSGSIA